MVIKAENTTFKEEVAKAGDGSNYGVPGAAEEEAKAEKLAAARKASRVAEEARTAPSFLDYQTAAVSTAVYPEAGTGSIPALTYVFAAVAEEVGELNGKWAKFVRDGGDMVAVREAIILEMGDVLWALANLSNEVDVALSEVAKKNVEKLASRNTRGVLRGSGDDR